MYVSIRLTIPLPGDYDFTKLDFTSKKDKVLHRNVNMAHDFVKEIIDFYNPAECAYCLEWINGIAEITKPHFHLNMRLPDFKSKDSIQKRIREKWVKEIHDEGDYKHYKGQNAYCCQTLDELDDEVRYWRYLLKQNPLNYYTVEGREPQCLVGNEFNIQRNNAQLEYQEKQERAVKAKKNSNNEKSKKNVMFREFKERNITDEVEFAVAMIDWHTSKGYITPFTKISDYWNTYQILTGLITSREWVNQHYLNINRKI